MRHTALWACTHIPNIIDLSRKKQLFDLEVKGQGPTKVIAVCDAPPYDHVPTYQISLTYLERQKCYDPDKKILFKKTIIWPWVQRSRSHKVIMVRDTPPYGHAPTYQISLTYLERQKCYGPDKLRWEEAEEADAEAEAEEEKIRLKQYVSLRSKGRHKYSLLTCECSLSI